MKQRIVLIILLCATWYSKGQNSTKDTLYFQFDSDYLVCLKNYEENNTIKFIDEEIVTSAFGQIIRENLLLFTQISNSKILTNLRPNSIHNLKSYLKAKPKTFIDNTTQHFDSYKIMRYFDRFTVYFIVDGNFIEIKTIATLQE
ncbi:hypothetical protein [Urechidicola vernalis]|uniref:Uncharacterized protein n=1 Tax=Urechidicola vernalis TaxID=3075600 RepID=A0ABU2Y875_9FLAO|nr:hypothetical protein [Urechidicola sp. P050]MDT0554036.1 hypothetical protein [Urechidicola sp. P050]